jgi:hypothetical protein
LTDWNKVMRDLVILVADKDMEQAVERLIRRTESLAIRPISYAIYMHPRRDSGCRTASLEVLRPLTNQFRYALVLFDHEGSGAEELGAEAVEERVQTELARNGWDARARVIAIDPELVIWMWSDSPELDRAIGWDGRQPPLRAWLQSQGFEFQEKRQAEAAQGSAGPRAARGAEATVTGAVCQGRQQCRRESLHRSRVPALTHDAPRLVRYRSLTDPDRARRSRYSTTTGLSSYRTV